MLQDQIKDCLGETSRFLSINSYIHHVDSGICGGIGEIAGQK